MNYIKQLQSNVTEQNSQRKAAETLLLEMVDYLNSPKFRCGDDLDGYVSITDILNRTENIRSVLSYGRAA